MYKLSIIIPIYNSESYLSECIESVLSQKLDSYEIILINDGSTDNSQQICNKYELNYSNIRSIKTENNGAASARNLGLTLAKGEYIGFVDSDDTIEPNMYESMYKLGKVYDADIVVCAYREIDDNGKILKNNKLDIDGYKFTHGEDIKKEYEECLDKNVFLGYPSMCNKIYKNLFIKENNLLVDINLRIAEDLCFNIDSFLNAKKIVQINEVLYNYRRINCNSIMNSRKKANLEDIKLNLKARYSILNTLSNYNIENSIYNKYAKYENHLTVTDFLDIIIDIIKSGSGIYSKVLKINKVINNDDFKKAFYNVELKYFNYKAKIIILFLKIFGRLKIDYFFSK